MFRSFWLAVGISLCILGGECLLIEKAVLAGARNQPAAVNSIPNPFADQVQARAKELIPPEWAPWSLLSAGAVIILYSFTIPRRVSAG